MMLTQLGRKGRQWSSQQLYELLVLVVKRLRKHHAFVESSLVLHECSIMPFQPFLTFLDACIRVLSRNGQSVSQEASDHIMGGFETSVTEKLLMLDAQYSPHPQPHPSTQKRSLGSGMDHQLGSHRINQKDWIRFGSTKDMIS